MDEEIYELIKNKNEKGMEMLIDKYAALIKAIVKKHLYNLPQYHEECINDVYFAIWNKITSFDKEKSILKNWIGAIAKYKAIDYKRKYLKMLNNIDISKIDIKSDFDVDREALKEEIGKGAYFYRYDELKNIKQVKIIPYTFKNNNNNSKYIFKDKVITINLK